MEMQMNQNTADEPVGAQPERSHDHFVRELLGGESDLFFLHFV